MNVTGIIAECNPFHEGHAFLLRQARLETDADYIVVALSGDYVQRGAPAITGWEPRVRAILENGADLVVALPLYVSCAGADYFARGAVALLDALGVTTDLVFGSETGDLPALQRAAALMAKETASFRMLLQDGLRSGLSFPAAREQALCGSTSPPAVSSEQKGSSPNDLLGAEYCKALAFCGSAMRPHAIRRIPCASASSIREKLLTGAQDVQIPFRGDADSALLSRDDFSEYLLAALLPHAFGPDRLAAGQSLPQCGRELLPGTVPLDAFLDVSADLANRIVSDLPYFDSFTGFCGRLKSKNLTYTRVSRALLHILLGMSVNTMQVLDQQFNLCAWIRPLGFRKEAGPLLHAIHEHASVPFLDKLSRADKVLDPSALAILIEEIRAEFLYDMVSHRKAQNRVRSAMEKKLVIV